MDKIRSEKFGILIIVMFITFNLLAQENMNRSHNALNCEVTTPTIEWEKSLGGTNSEIARAIQQTSDGGYVVTGYSQSVNGDVTGAIFGFDFWLAKLNNLGILEWEKSFGGVGEEDANSIQQTSDGGFILAGYSNLSSGDVTGNHGEKDYWVVKLNSFGILEWQKSLGGSADDVAESIEQTNDGGFIVAGYTNSTDGDVTVNYGGNDYWIVKLDNLGNLEWEKSFGGSQSENANSIKQTFDGGYIVGGLTISMDGDVTESFGVFDYWVVKLDNQGSMVWQKSFGGSDSDMGTSIQQTADGGFIMAGRSMSTDGDVSVNLGNIDYWVIKIDNLGNLEWEKSYGGTSNDIATSIQQTNDGGYIVAGVSNSSDGDVTGNHGNGDYWVVKLNNLGTIEWEKALGGTKSDFPYSIQQTSDNGFIIAGESQSDNGDVSQNLGFRDFWVVKLFPVYTAITLSDSTINVSCNGLSDGYINVMPSGGLPPYTYLWSNNATQQEIVDLPAGNYQLTVVDANECEVEQSITITQPSLINSTGVVTPESLPNSNDGTIDLTVNGGTPPYTYQWDNGALTEDVDALSPGNYCVTITDSNSCQANFCETVFQGTTNLTEIQDLVQFEIYPNPAHVSTTIEVSFITNTNIELKIVDVLGSEIYSMKDNLLNGQFEFDLNDYSQGTYLVMLKTEKQMTIKKMVLIR